MKEETNNEKLILQAAEEEFISKGYSGTKTTSIAQKAGVTHAMLHYYYRTKENLFQKVFQQKAQLIASSFETIFDEELPLEQSIKSLVEKHFDFVIANGQLINFVLHEVHVNKENGKTLRTIVFSKISPIMKRFENMINREISSGTIKAHIKPMELFANIITLNLSAFLSTAIMGETQLITLSDDYLKERKENNVQYILSSLKT